MSNPPRQPPRYVPTLTEVVQSNVVPVTSATAPLALAQEALEDQIIHRVMQRVDLSLERRLREAVAAMVLQQTQSMVPRLREEIEFVVRQSVSDAVADELATRQTP
ncbi:hypothetical protein J2X19_001542 [Rhodoferax ferrireducens]|uniref:DUF2486 domain-containing protein n=1 Tax=Rhodoferax ferrireducens TaxID=192843 RepID=A0ABU2C6C6_9BURK|nr:hypothetical protein [Rhodoferax ferrireducens]MDR7376884.1 hypothetical protein [Rhodoferax ferrireducens]